MSKPTDGFGEQFLLSYAGYDDVVNHVVAAQVPTGINVQDVFSSTGLAFETGRGEVPEVPLPAGAGLLAAALTLIGLKAARRRGFSGLVAAERSPRAPRPRRRRRVRDSGSGPELG